MSRFPKAKHAIESGVLKCSNLVQRDGKWFLYSFEFNPNAGARLLQVEVVTTNQMIYAEQKELSLEEFSALTKQ